MISFIIYSGFIEFKDTSNNKHTFPNDQIDSLNKTRIIDIKETNLDITISKLDKNTLKNFKVIITQFSNI